MSDANHDLVHPAEIIALLTEAAAQQVRLELQSGAEHRLSLPIVRVDPAGRLLVLRWPDLQANALPAWLQPGVVQAHASLDKIRIDFSLHAPAQLHLSDDLPELHWPMPQCVRRHQRRESFRVAPLTQAYPRVRLTLPGHTKAVHMSTADLSGGGVALQWPSNVPPPAVGTRLEPVDLELARELRLSLRLQVQHVHSPTDGPSIVGCGFDALTPQAERVLLLQLQQLQRRHRALSPSATG